MNTNVIVKFLYEDLLMPDDTHRSRARKRLIALNAPLGMALEIALALTNLPFKDATPSEVLNFLVRIVGCMFMLLLWATTRYKRAVTDAMGNAFILAMNVIFLSVILLDPKSGMEGVLLAFVLFVVIFNAQSLFVVSMRFPLLTAVLTLRQWWSNNDQSLSPRIF